MGIRESLQRTAVATMVAFATTGCTEERALAVKAAAEGFAAKAVEAIEATVELHVRALIGKPVDDEVRIQQTRQELVKTQKIKPAALNSVITTTAFEWVNEREALRRQAFADYDQLKALYGEFADAYKRLPEGSLLAAKDVSCSAALAARLVSHMASAAKHLVSKPPPFAVERVHSGELLATAAAAAAKSGSSQALDSAVRGHVALLREEERAAAEAASKLADAAEAGAAALDLIEKYADLSAADIVKGLRRVLVLRETSFGISSQAKIARLDEITAKLNTKPALAKALQVPLNEKPDDCK